MKKITLALGILGSISGAVALAGFWASQTTATTHPFEPAKLGQASTVEALALSFQNSEKVTLKTIKAADWQVPLSGLLNLDHPTSKAAGLEDRDEAIQVYSFHISHPIHGDYFVDTGVSDTFANNPEGAGISGWLVPQLGIEKLHMSTSTERYMETLQRPIKGVFLTHLHIDHISGLPAIPVDTPLFIGPSEASSPYFLYAATAASVDRLLAGRPTLQEWRDNIVDIFGDGSVFAIHSPGHTSGSTAFLVNTIAGPVLLTGDASHTTWGWEHDVEPGKFSSDMEASRKSLSFLTNLVRMHPEIEVKVGHQHF